MELKDCLVCKGKAIVVSYHWDPAPSYENTWLDEYHIECVNCGMSSYSYPTEKEAATAWNTRLGEKKKCTL